MSFLICASHLFCGEALPFCCKVEWKFQRHVIEGKIRGSEWRLNVALKKERGRMKSRDVVKRGGEEILMS